MDITLLLFVLSFISGIMIGGNCAYVMAAPFGAGVISRKRALLFYVLFMFLGAVLAGKGVAQSLNKNIVGAIDPLLGAVALISLLICVLIANLVKVPLSTSEMATGAIAGIGIFFGSLISRSLLDFYASWIVGAFICFFISYASTRAFELKAPRIPFQKALLIAVGCFFAFSMGANNVGNSIFPLLGTISISFALFFGGISLIVGGFIFSGRTMEKLGKDVTEIDAVSGLFSSLVAAVALMAMSFMGLPAPAAHFYTMSLFGVGAAKGRGKVSLRAIAQIILIWIISPVLSIGISYGVLIFLY